jgi:hypothetical protein
MPKWKYHTLYHHINNTTTQILGTYLPLNASTYIALAEIGQLISASVDLQMK